jgi:ABC-type transport system involved in multi-copper enzyme maturation permease subunit
MKAKLLRLWRWFVNRLPETFLLFFVVALVPAIVMGCAEVARQIGYALKDPGGYWEELVAHSWQVAAVGTCILGILGFVVFTWRNWGAVWAVARKMILEALHRRVVLIILFFFVLLTLSMPFMLKTEGSLTSRTQLVMYYSLGLAMLLISLLAIFVSVASVSSEIERKNVHVTDTKPLRRRDFLFGKWLGVLVMCTAVHFVMAGAACVLILCMVREPNVQAMLPDEAAKAAADYQNVLNEVFVARQTHHALDPSGIDRAVEERLKALEESGELPESLFELRRLRRRVRSQVLRETTIVEPFGAISWAFRGLRRGSGDELVFVRFKAYSSRPGGRLFGRWLVADRVVAPPEDEGGTPTHRFRVLGVRFAPDTGWMTDVRTRFTFPASMVGEDGTVYLAYENTDGEATVKFDDEFRVQLLQEGGAFLPNYYRATVVLLCHFALLAALGIMAGAIFSFPVASLAVVFIFVVGLVGTWFSSFLAPDLYGDYTLGEEIVKLGWQGFLKAVLWVMPHFAKFNPLDNLTDGQMITWGTVASAGAVMVVLRGGVALLIGMFFYARRELARVIV